MLGDDNLQSKRTGACAEVVPHQGISYASVVTKGQNDSKSSSSLSENDRVKPSAKETLALLNIPNAVAKGKCFSTGLDGKHNLATFAAFKKHRDLR